MLGAWLCCPLSIILIFDGSLFTFPTKYLQRFCDSVSVTGCGCRGVVGGTTFMFFRRCLGDNGNESQ